MNNILKYLGYTLIFGGFITILGVAGNDCDGKCMENSMTLIEMLKYSVLGMSSMSLGIYLGVKYGE